MIDIEELIYSGPRIKDLSSGEILEYDKFIKEDIEQLMKNNDISEDDIIVFTKSLINAFENIRYKQTKSN